MARLSFRILTSVALFAVVVIATQIPLFPPRGWPDEGPSSTNSSTALRRRLDQVLPQIHALREIGGTAGASIGVMHQGDLLFEHHLGHADVERGLAASSSTRYVIASLTKAFVASTIAQLVRDGASEWDAPLTRYVPELSFRYDPTLAEQLSLNDILSHRTGLARLDGLWLGAYGQTFIDESFTVALCNNLPILAPVRSKFLYNNWMYALAGQLIKAVTGVSWGHVLAERVLKPLGLSETTVIASEVPADSLARPYIILNDQKPAPIKMMDLTDGSIMASAGGVRSSLGDMLHWGNALLSVFGNEEPKIASLDNIFSGHSFINSTSVTDELYAMGWAKITTPAQLGKIGFNPTLVTMPIIGTRSNPQRVFYHSGGGVGYNHCFMLVPELQTVIAVLTNSISQGDTADWIAQSILQAVLGDKEDPIDLEPLAKEAATNWRGTYQAIVDQLSEGRKPNSKKPSLKALVGKYWHPTKALYLEVFLLEDGGGDVIKFNLNGKPEQTHILTHYADDTFCFLPSSDEERLRSGLFHYSAPAWLLHFGELAAADVDGKKVFTEVKWHLDAEVPVPETFYRE